MSSGGQDAKLFARVRMTLNLNVMITSEDVLELGRTPAYSFFPHKLILPPLLLHWEMQHSSVKPWTRLTYITGQSRRAAPRAPSQWGQERQELLIEKDSIEEDCCQHDHEQQRHGCFISRHHCGDGTAESGDQEDVGKARGSRDDVMADKVSQVLPLCRQLCESEARYRIEGFTHPAKRELHFRNSFCDRELTIDAGSRRLEPPYACSGTANNILCPCPPICGGDSTALQGITQRP